MAIVVDELVDVLNRERHLLENLVFRLIEARGLLATGEARFLGWAASDIEAAAAAVREVELRRATVLAGATNGPLPTLAMLVADTSEPWTSLLEDHRMALGRLVGEVGAALESTHDLAVAGLERVLTASNDTDGRPERLDDVGDHLGTRWARDTTGDDRREHRSTLQPKRSRPFADLDDLDREITAAGYEAVLTATDRMTLPSLYTFLS